MNAPNLKTLIWQHIEWPLTCLRSGCAYGSADTALDGLASPEALAARAREIEAARADISRLDAAEAAAAIAHGESKQLVQLAKEACERASMATATPEEITAAQALVDALHLDVLRRIWARVDDDGNGVLDRLEFHSVLVLLEDAYSSTDASTHIMDYSHTADAITTASVIGAPTGMGAATATGMVHGCRWLEQADQIFDAVDTDNSDSLGAAPRLNTSARMACKLSYWLLGFLYGRLQ